MVKINWETKFHAMRTKVELAVKAQIEKVLMSAVGSARCAVHKKYAEVNLSGKGLDKLDFQVNGCCEDFIAQVEGKLANL